MNDAKRRTQVEAQSAKTLARARARDKVEGENREGDDAKRIKRSSPRGISRIGCIVRAEARSFLAGAREREFRL